MNNKTCKHKLTSGKRQGNICSVKVEYGKQLSYCGRHLKYHQQEQEELEKRHRKNLRKHIRNLLLNVMKPGINMTIQNPSTFIVYLKHA